MKAYHISLYIILSFLFSAVCHTVYAAEVEGVEESKIPPGLEKTIELRKESEFKLIQLVDITALGISSKVSGGNTSGGGDLRATISPVLRLDKKHYIIPLYYGSYKRERQVVVEEEGGRVYNELADHNVTLEYKQIFGENTVFKLDGLSRLHYVKEKGYDWSKGLYDYEDIGMGSSVEFFLKKTKSERNSFTIGGEYYFRKYPNYESLISLATVTAPEAHEKDYDGLRPMLKYNYLNPRINCAFTYSPLYKGFRDKKVIDSNGVLTDKGRKDWFHYANAKLSYLPQRSPVAFGLGLTGIVVDSNQNYYDSKSTVTLSDDEYTKDYYSFKSISANPSLTYIYRLKNLKKPATFTVGYGYMIRHYDGRRKRNAGGEYRNSKQLDQSHTISFQSVYPITENLSIVGLASYVKGYSNMKYETYYQYNYESYYAGGGIRVKY